MCLVTHTVCRYRTLTILIHTSLVVLFSALYLNDKLVACSRLLRCQQSSSLAWLAVCPSWGQFHLTPIMTFKTCPQGKRGRGEGGGGEPCGKHQTQYTAPAAASGHTSLLFGKLYSLNSDSFIMMLRNIFPLHIFKLLLISC